MRKLQKPEELVIAIVGDAGFQMTLQELSVLKEHALPVKVFILNNEALGMVRQWQDEFYNQRYSHSLLPCQPDFVALANAYGIKGVRIDDPLLAKKQIQHAIELQEPVVIDCRTSIREGYADGCARKRCSPNGGSGKRVKRIVTATVRNQSGVLNRITGL